MRFRRSVIVACGLLVLASTGSWADLTPYSQDFEALDAAPDLNVPNALWGDGWKIFGNVWLPFPPWYYGYGPFPAPNDGAAFSKVVVGEGGPSQGAKQLDIYSDYNNGDHGNGATIESNVFQEQTIGAGDVGSMWVFEFDAKRGNIEGATTAAAFFKTLDPGNGYALTNYIPVDMTDVPTDWGTYQAKIFIDPGLVGQILQFGFLNVASNWEGSGVYYDNIVFEPRVDAALDVRPGSCPNPLLNRSRGVMTAALLGTANLDVNDIDISSLQLEGVAPIRVGYEDVAEPFEGELCGCMEALPDGYLDLTLKFVTQQLLDAIGPVPSGELVVTVTGTLLDGTPLEGQDCVLMIDSGEPPGGGEKPRDLIESPTSTNGTGSSFSQ